MWILAEKTLQVKEQQMQTSEVGKDPFRQALGMYSD